MRYNIIMQDDKPIGGLQGALTAKQERFVQEYLIDLNATAAYKRAGYKGMGRVAENAASRMLGNVGVKAAIENALAKTAKRSAATIERIELELERLALSDPRRLFAPDGSIKPIAEWDDDSAATVASIEVVEEFSGKGKSRRLSGYAKKLKCWEKGRAIVELLRRRDLAGKPPLGSQGNPLHHAIAFIEFADTEAPPGEGGTGRADWPALEPSQGPAPGS